MENINYIHISNIFKQSIPTRTGAYIITHTHDNIHVEKYVGSSKNLHQRMCNHNKKIIMNIDLYVTDDINVARSLEIIIMKLIMPSTNIIINTLSDKDKELMKKILEDTKLKEQILNTNIKIGYRHLKLIDAHNKYEIERKIINKAGAIPLSNELIELVKNRQLKMSNEKGKVVTLTEVSNEIVKKGLESMIKNDVIKEDK